MVEGVALALAAVVAVGAAALLTKRTSLPAPVVLVVVGLVYAELPGPNVELDPDVILLLVLPPLLYSAALSASLIEIRSHLRVVVLLSVGLVVVTALTVAGLLTLVVAGLPFAAACAFGAAVAPNDPVAALAIGRRVGLPRRLVSIVEGESLINDATALTAYQVAIVAVAGSFSVGDVASRFATAVVGGVAVGLGVGWLLSRLRRVLDEPVVENLLSLATPFLAFLPAEEIGASGVLAVVVCGLWLGHQAPVLMSGAARLQGRAVWRLVDLVLEGLVFLLIGQQLPVVLEGLRPYSTSTLVLASAVSLGAVLLVRPVWLILTIGLPARLSRPRDETGLRRRELAALSWAGMRGVVSLAAAFALPFTSDGRPFPERDLLIFLTFVVVLGTLLGQGLTFAPLLTRLGVRDDPGQAQASLGAARHAAVEAGLRRLDAVADDVPAEVLDRLRQQALDRQDVGRGHDIPQDGPDEYGYGPGARLPAYTRLRSEMIAAERAELLARRRDGRLDDADLRRLQRELDHEERALTVLTDD